MDLMEYRAHALFAEYGIASNRGIVVNDREGIAAAATQVRYPAVVKAQVPVGGRGKAGGVRFADNGDELIASAEAILGMNIKGHTVGRLMISHMLPAEREYYLAITLDRDEKCPVLLFCPEGGVEIEAHPERVARLYLRHGEGVAIYHARYLGGLAGFDGELQKKLFALLQKLYRLFCEYDCMLCEINPLTVIDGEPVALDAKISVDDSALKRLPSLDEYRSSLEREPLVAEAESFNFLYIPCDSDGHVTVMSNGSGMLMSVMDALARRDIRTLATLDLGGGATAERICEAVRIITSDPRGKYLFINIFGGITRCDEVARGIVSAVGKYGIDKPVVVRFEGTNKETGLEIIGGCPGVIYADGLIEGVEAIVHEYSH